MALAPEVYTNEASIPKRNHCTPATIGRKGGFFDRATAHAALPHRDWAPIGERFDPETGLHYLHARYYDPKLGLFTQGDWWDPTVPGVGTNRYMYSAGDPVNLNDPNWHVFQDPSPIADGHSRNSMEDGFGGNVDMTDGCGGCAADAVANAQDEARGLDNARAAGTEILEAAYMALT